MNVNGIIGHTKQLNNLESLIKNECIPNALLFTGPSGIGKRLIAERFLNSLFCKSPNTPCLSCSVCNQIAKRTFPDFIVISPNEKGIIPIGSKEVKEKFSIRWLNERLSRKSVYNKLGIIIDQVEKTSEEGQNAILKSIEEPALDVHIILISSNRSRLLSTIISRCSEVRFTYPTSDDVINILSSKYDSVNNIDLITYLCCGSVEIASILSNKDDLNEILKLCLDISSFLKNGKKLDINTSSIQKKIGTDTLLDIIINIYRQNIMSIIEERVVVFSELAEIFIEDKEKLLLLLKILFLLKKRITYNLNIRYALKGLLYSIHTIFDDNRSTVLPLIEFADFERRLLWNSPV